MNAWGLSAVVGAMLAPLALPTHAQLGNFLERVLPPALQGSAPGAARDAGVPGIVPRNSPSAAMAGGAPPPIRHKDVIAELQPDRECKRPQERFNVVEKAVEYGGTAASLRLEHLIRSDFRRDDLTKEDREMLRYLAHTTVWLPVEVENRLGDAFDLTSRQAQGSGTEIDSNPAERVEARIAQLLGAVQDFPGKIKLVVDAGMHDGAVARFGGVILFSEPFATAMSQTPGSGDLILAHELSHIYKRHAIKQMQFQLLSTDEGWDLARKILQRAMRGASFDPIRDGMFVVTTVPQLIGFVRSVQLQFSREQELEADACAVIWLRAVSADPARAWDAFVASMAGQPSQAGGYASSHPPTAEREANFKNKVEGRSVGVKAPSRRPVRPPARQ